MKKHSSQILLDFDSNKFLYEEFAEITTTLIKSLIGKTISVHQISSRVKDKESLSGKLIRKNHKYSEIKELTDIIGLRIVLYFEDDIDLIANLLENEFEIDKPNSIDKRQVEADKFGYRSLHYVASLSKTRLALTEYKKFEGLQFEIQIRSILQHSWAEIEHDLGYKGESEIPNTAKRTFYRVAALLEQADIEFVKLRKEISEYEIIIKEQIASDTSKVEIDKSSLIAFIKESNTLKSIEEELQSVACERGDIKERYISEYLLRGLKDNKIFYLNELEKLLIDNKDKIINFVSKEFSSLPDPKPAVFTAGASIGWLLNVIDEEKENARAKRSLKRKK